MAQERASLSVELTAERTKTSATWYDSPLEFVRRALAALFASINSRLFSFETRRGPPRGLPLPRFLPPVPSTDSASATLLDLTFVRYRDSRIRRSVIRSRGFRRDRSRRGNSNFRDTRLPTYASRGSAREKYPGRASLESSILADRDASRFLPTLEQQSQCHPVRGCTLLTVILLGHFGLARDSNDSFVVSRSTENGFSNEWGVLPKDLAEGSTSIRKLGIDWRNPDNGP